MRETLDEAIDRVASTLTTVSPDAGFADRLGARLDRRPPHGTMWLVAATATSVLLATLLVDLRLDVGEPAVESTSTAPASIAAAASDVAALPPNEVSASREVETSRAGGAVRPSAPAIGPAAPAIEMPPIPTIAALTGPSSLSVEELQLKSLAVSPVEVVYLDEVAALELPELDKEESR